MRNKIAFLLFFFTAVTFAQITSSDFLKVSTGAETWHIVNERGERVYLRGVNAGGWLVQEGWMNPTNMHDQITMLRDFDRRFGADKRREFINIYEDNYWTELDFDNCAAMGMSVIRLPFTYMNLVEYNAPITERVLRPDAWQRLDWFIENAGKRGIYVILDMHGAFGSQNGMDHSGEINDGWQLYNNPQNRAKTVWLWGEIAKRYAKNGTRGDLAATVAMYDILNEPGPKAAIINSTQWDFFDEIYKEIRRHDPDHIVCMESCWDAQHLPHPSRYGWTNVVYQYHYYGWGDLIGNSEATNRFTDSKTQNIRNTNHGVPTFVGEFTFFNLPASWDYGLQVYNNNGWHWTSWTYKVTGNSSWGIYNHNPTKVNPGSDTEAQIRDRWSRVGTANGWANNMIRDAIMAKTPGTIGGKNPFTTANIALNKPIQATSTENQNYSASNANDGLATTRWASMWGTGAAIVVDLEDTYQINGVRLLWEAAFAKGYEVEIAADDNYNWQLIKTETNGSGGINNIEVDNVLGRFVKVTGTERATINGEQYGYSLYEFEVYGKKASVINIPGTFNSLDYSDKSNEIRDNNNEHGKFVGNLIDGSYLDYTVNVQTAGNYEISLELARNNAAPITVSINKGGNRLSALQVSGTDWFDFKQTKTGINLSAGAQTIRIQTTGAVNIRDISIQPTDNIVSLSIPDGGFVYTGAEIKPTVLLNGAAITAGVTYRENINAGEAFAVYSGKDYPFIIAKKDLLITLKQKEYKIEVGDEVPVNFNYEIEAVGLVGNQDLCVIQYTDCIDKDCPDVCFDAWNFYVSHNYSIDDAEPSRNRITIGCDRDIYAKNYNIIFDGDLFLIAGNPVGTSIKKTQKFDGKHGIVFTESLAKDKAVIIVKTPEPTTVKIIIYDITGNIVFDRRGVSHTPAEIVWNLTNNAGRKVAGGAYLVVVEAKSQSGTVYRYSAKMGVKR